MIEVAAGLVFRSGKLLITQRYPDAHLGGLWEFPGGKPEPGERQEDALVREIREELGAAVSVGERIETVEWQYPDKRVSLTFFRCALSGEPQPLEGQEMAWVRTADLSRYQFPEADAALIERLSRG